MKKQIVRFKRAGQAEDGTPLYALDNSTDRSGARPLPDEFTATLMIHSPPRDKPPNPYGRELEPGPGKELPGTDREL